MKRPRYYSRESQILKAIDRSQRNVKARRRLAVIWHNRYRARLKDSVGSYGRTQVVVARENSDHYNRLADQIEATTLRKLKNKLAEFRTVPMAGIGLAEVRVR